MMFWNLKLQESLPLRSVSAGYTQANKNMKKLIIIFLSLIIIVSSYFLIVKIEKDPTSHNKKIVSLEKILQNGDIICTLGNGYWSTFFQEVSLKDKRFSHVGIIIKENQVFKVIHSEANDYTGIGGVKISTLNDFIKNTLDHAVYRIEANKNIRNEIATTAIEYSGIPFDMDFNIGDAKEIYCAELIMLAINKTMKEKIITPIKIDKKEVITIDRCYASDKIIKIFDYKKEKNRWFQHVQIVLKKMRLMKI